MVLPLAVETRFQRVEREFAASARLKKYGYRPKRRILLHGPPGCGKTLGAERLAWNTGLPLRRVRFETLLSSYFGETASNLHRVFDDARRTPSALLLDECDTIASSRVLRHDVGEVPRIVNTLLQLLEEYSGDGLIIAATNLTENLDSALFRRFDEVIEICLPSVEDIARLLELSLSAMEKERGLQWLALARALDGHSCSEVTRVAENAAKRCILEGRSKVTQADVKCAMEELNHLALNDHAR
ncbi:MAG: ATP-binding protein [Rhodospirillales bacterium]|nr:ATP-binding protein [Acetobacter sp.]